MDPMPRAPVLLLEPELSVRTLLASILAKSGRLAVLAASPGEALERLASDPALSLVVASGDAGLALCRSLRARHETPYRHVVALALRGGRQEMVEALDAGAVSWRRGRPMTEPEQPVDPSAANPAEVVGESEVEDDVEAAHGPPPLPPSPSTARGPVEPPPARAAAGKRLAWGVLFAVLLAGAAFGGLRFGELVRGKPSASATVVSPVEPPKAAAAPAAAPPSASSPAPAPAAVTGVNLPAVEIR
jgi:CheY-like chemotaxis protein